MKFDRMKSILKRVLRGGNREELEREYRLSHGMKIGKNVNIYSWGSIDAGKPWLIAIGNNVTISTNVTILTHDASTNMVQCGTKLGKVTIGNNVFIGTGTIVLCNVHIADNVIIGAGSVVSHDLKQSGVYVGVPAKRVCSIEDYKKKYQHLREIRPNFDKIRPWDDWKNSTIEERKFMSDALEDGIGFF